MAMKDPTDLFDQNTELLLGEIDRILVYLSKLDEKNENPLLVFCDFDDTLFYRRGFRQKIEKGEIEEAYNIPITPMPHTLEFMNFLKEKNVPMIIVTKRTTSDTIKKKFQEYKLDDHIEEFLNQRNEQTQDGSTSTISKGQIICEYLEKRRKPQGILFVDDMKENNESVSFWMSRRYPEIETRTVLIPGE